MKDDKKVPQLRFPEFTDAWKQRKFSEVFEEYSEKKHPELPALTIIQGKGTILRDASDRNLLYDKANLASYKLVRKDDFIVHLRTFEGGLEKANSDGIVSPAYHIFHGKNTDTRFFYPFFRSKYFIDALLKPHVYGIRDGKSIDIEGMKTISFLVPSFEEQNKIGKFVETLDNTITLQQRKLNSLQKLKKGLLQKMFPKNGENIPEIRFPEFSDAWKQRKVGDLLVERREMVTEDNEYPLMAFIANEGVAPKGDRFDRSALVKNADSKKYKRTKYGDFIYSSNNLESGSIGLNKYGKASISPVYSIFYPTNLADSDFIGRYFLRKDFIGQMIRWRQGVVYGQWKIPEADFLNIDIYIPSKDEQEKIGQILDKVDNTITLQQRKLESLQKLKKGLLQQMFI